MQNANLEFRKIPSLQFLYEVNENGTIIRNVKSKRHLKCFKQSHNGNTQYWCTQVNIKHKIHKVFIHRVVAECWLGSRPEGLQVDHIDRNSLNNHYTNLRYVTKSEQMINRNYADFEKKIWKNLASKNGGKVNPVKLTDCRTNEKKEFSTARKAAKYLAQIYDKKEKSFNDKFHLRRKHIFDFDVIYLNAETGHGNLQGKEQSAENVYLTGSLDSWNDAKRAEERDRVKHANFDNGGASLD